MRRPLPWWAALAPAAVAAEGLALWLLRTIWRGAHGGEGGLGESLELSLSYACLGLGGILGAVLVTAGTYLLLRRSRLLAAVPLIVLFVLPAQLVAAVYLYGLAVLLALI